MDDTDNVSDEFLNYGPAVLIKNRPKIWSMQAFPITFVLFSHLSHNSTNKSNTR